MHESWQTFLKSEFEKDYFCRLSTFLHDAYASSQVFPAKQQVFRAFMTDLAEVKVVILGQDPYHTPGAAHGLAFSVPSSQPIPPSLVNIYREIDSECGSHANQDGNLKSWQQQGVLLLNNVLTVEAHKAGSHRNKGWEIFTEAVIRHLSSECDNLVFLLWGRDARSKKAFIDTNRHLVLESAHPSPLSAHNGFFGNGHFKATNEYLKSHGKPEIVW